MEDQNVRRSFIKRLHFFNFSNRFYYDCTLKRTAMLCDGLFDAYFISNGFIPFISDRKENYISTILIKYFDIKKKMRNRSPLKIVCHVIRMCRCFLKNK